MRRNRWTAAGIAAVSLILARPAGAAQPTVCSAQFQTAAGHHVTGTADLDGSGKVDAADLAVVLAAWGTDARPADVDGDGAVGCYDLWYVRGNWGPCPPASLDLDGDHQVDEDDQGLLLSAFGACTVDADADGVKEQHEPTLDLDNNGQVDDHDLGALFCFWGPARPGGPDADFDANGAVGHADLTILARHLGRQCPHDLDQDGSVGVADIEVLVKGWGS
jgi:hypothetical protein